MINKPIDIPRYIQISVKEPLEPRQKLSWLSAVRTTAPSGVIATIQTTDDTGLLHSVVMVHKEGKKSNAYLIPLARDLQPNEVQKIVEYFAEIEPDLDFDIETNEIIIDPSEMNAIPIDDRPYFEICTALAKGRHERWMRDRLNSGWRYGIDFSLRKKTHPLLRPWDQLPDQFKQPDFDSPQAILDIINNQGYAIIAVDQLNRLRSNTRI